MLPKRKKLALRCYACLRLIFLSLSVGAFAAFFAKSCEWSFNIFLYIYRYHNDYIVFIIPSGCILITLLVKKYYPEAEGSGIPQALALKHTKELSKISKFFVPKVIISKYLLITLSTGIGATVGREGPTVQISAAIMSLFKKNLSAPKKRILLTIGAASGLAAAFNTPLGGIVFFFEELARSFSHRLNLVKITGIVVCSLTAVLITGNYSYYGRVERELLFYDSKIFLVAVIIGVCAALNSFLFSKAIYFITLSPLSRINLFRKKHPYWTSLICGLAMVWVGMLSHGLSFGNGYIESRAALSGTETLPPFYYLYKMLGALFSTSSGVPGGYFATSLAIGNGIGSCIHSFFSIANVQQYGLLGMVAFLSALTHAPLTAFVMVLQITSSQVFTLPLLVAGLTATWVSSSLSPSIYVYQVKKLLG